ncbi:MAG TPA: NAD-dependent epimerase/dehydratase family protein, partial [Aggregatilineales bacterium]|nr:NAD-dependent epimerase/dehydratase family protein [Aggregatilineales bacterium]
MDSQINFWHERRVLITGAGGLVGAWLCKYLYQQGAFVVGMIHHPNPQSELYRSGVAGRITVAQGALENMAFLEETLSKYAIDTVFHLGAQAIVSVANANPLQTFESNIRGTYLLLEACRRQKVARIIVASSDKAYGTQPDLPYLENMPLQGVYPYEVSKTCTDLIAQSYAVTYDLPLAIGRCGNIYGGGDLNWNRIIPETIRNSYHNTPLTIRSDGTFQRDYVYVKDVVLAYVLLAENLHRPEVRGGAFNFGPHKPLTVLEVVNEVLRLMDCTHLKPIIANTAKGEIRDQYLDSTKAQNLLDWHPR